MEEKVMNPDRIKHLEFIQDIVTRMGANSFQIKGWSITIFSALLALFAGSQSCEKHWFLYAAAIQSTIFWFLDTYYLWQERKFRGVYNDVAGLIAPDKMLQVRLFEMPVQKYKGGKYSYWNVFRSITIWLLYVPMIIIAIIGGFFLQ